MEQLLINDLPIGTLDALKRRAQQHHRSVEAETHAIIAEVLSHESSRLLDFFSTDEGVDIVFSPERIGLAVPGAELSQRTDNSQ